MKRINYIAAILAIVAGAVSCSKEFGEEWHYSSKENDGVIRFCPRLVGSLAGDGTKGHYLDTAVQPVFVDTTVMPHDYVLYTSGYVTDTVDASNSGNYFRALPFRAIPDLMTGDTTWRSDAKYYWPFNSMIDITAIAAPDSIDLRGKMMWSDRRWTDAVLFTMPDDSAHLMVTDYMYAATHFNRKEISTAVPLDFRHALSWITLKMKLTPVTLATSDSFVVFKIECVKPWTHGRFTVNNLSLTEPTIYWNEYLPVIQKDVMIPGSDTILLDTVYKEVGNMLLPPNQHAAIYKITYSFPIGTHEDGSIMWSDTVTTKFTIPDAYQLHLHEGRHYTIYIILNKETFLYGNIVDDFWREEFRSENPDRGLGVKRARVTQAGAGTSPFRRGGSVGVYENLGRNDDYIDGTGRNDDSTEALDPEDASTGRVKRTTAGVGTPDRNTAGAGSLERNGVSVGEKYDRSGASTSGKYEREGVGTEKFSRTTGPF